MHKNKRDADQTMFNAFVSISFANVGTQEEIMHLKFKSQNSITYEIVLKGSI